MKSIVEEASTIAKAIEKAWYSAGNPSQFSVKVLEEPKKNFLGFTTHSAKIALIFEEKHVLSPSSTETQQSIQKPVNSKKAQQKQAIEPSKTEQKNNNQKTEVWSKSLINQIKEWIEEILTTLDKKDINFNLTSDNYHLKVIFNKAVYPEVHKQKQFFASLSTLLLQMLKKKFNRPLRGYKIIITHD